MPAVNFSLDDAQRAADEWGFNCGPASICAVLGMTPDEIRPHLGDFEKKGYTNPTLMFRSLDSLGATWKQVYRSDIPTWSLNGCHWPECGLVRIQFGGPWTNPGVPMRVRYRHTHWVSCRGVGIKGFVFDVNAMCVMGWLPYLEWAHELTPWLIKKSEPKASGKWWPTHCIEVH